MACAGTPSGALRRARLAKGSARSLGCPSRSSRWPESSAVCAPFPPTGLCSPAMASSGTVRTTPRRRTRTALRWRLFRGLEQAALVFFPPTRDTFLPSNAPPPPAPVPVAAGRAGEEEGDEEEEGEEAE